MFSINTTSEKFKTSQSRVIFGFVFDENPRELKPHDYRVDIVFRKALISNGFPKAQCPAAVSNSSSLKSVFEKLCLLDTLLCRPKCRNKVAFSSFPGVMWTMPKYAFTSQMMTHHSSLKRGS